MAGTVQVIDRLDLINLTYSTEITLIYMNNIGLNSQADLPKLHGNRVGGETKGFGLNPSWTERFTGSLFTNYSLERSLSYSPDCFLFVEAFECNTTSDWLNHTV